MADITAEQLQTDTLRTIAWRIARDWQGPYFGAVPYLDAMATLDDVGDAFGADSGASVVAYFLANARVWRGPVARLVKVELNRRLRPDYRKEDKR